MTTGAPPPNYTFNSSKRIPPMMIVKPSMYTANGYIPHPLQILGQAGGVAPRMVAPAGVTGNIPGGFAWSAGHPHTINGREPGLNY